jgi:hypothetical protein
VNDNDLADISPYRKIQFLPYEDRLRENYWRLTNEAYEKHASGALSTEDYDGIMKHYEDCYMTALSLLERKITDVEGLL